MTAMLDRSTARAFVRGVLQIALFCGCVGCAPELQYPSLEVIVTGARDDVRSVTVGLTTDVDASGGQTEAPRQASERDGRWRVMFDTLGRGERAIRARAYNQEDQLVQQAASSVSIGKGPHSVTLDLQSLDAPCSVGDCGHLDAVCVVGVVDQESCRCVTEPRRDDSPCDDQDICTEPDRCQSGRCVGTRLDADGDGASPRVGCGELDCDDSDPAIHPSARERCDGKDNDCDGVVDNRCDEGFYIEGRLAPAAHPLGNGLQVRGRFVVTPGSAREQNGERFEVTNASLRFEAER